MNVSFYLMINKVLTLTLNFLVSYQLGLVEREINQLLRSNLISKINLKRKNSKKQINGLFIYLY